VRFLLMFGGSVSDETGAYAATKDDTVECPEATGRAAGLVPAPEAEKKPELTEAEKIRATAIAKILSGTVEDVKGFLKNTSAADNAPGVFGELRAAEVAGKNRAGVLTAIDEALKPKDLTPPVPETPQA
jgi:hypothetical protein